MKQVYLNVAMTTASLLFATGGMAIGLDLSSVTFDHAPRLSRMTTMNRAAYFTITVPQDAGENLAQLSFSDLEQRSVPFDVEKAQVFVGERANGEAIAFEDVWIDETGVIWLSFAPAIVPGTTFTVMLPIQQNSPSGTHQYSVAAYPESDNSISAFTGDGTLVISK
jgi:hypothetical protein